MAAELTEEQVADLEERLFALLAEESDDKGGKGGKGDKGDKNFWTVELVRPPGASTGLLAYIAMAEAAIQCSVNLLGIGTTSPPPIVDELIRPVVYENLGKSEATEDYKDTLTKVEARQGALLRADRNVVDIAKYVSSEEDQTLRAIKDIVGDLNGKLEAVGKGELKASEEMNLLRHIAEAVAAVQHKVTVVAELNNEMAGSEGDGAEDPGSGESGSGGGGGGGGIASMLPMLAMLPLAAMPLLNMVPELLENLNGESEEGEGGKQAPEGAPAPDDGPAPTDPRNSGEEDQNPDGNDEGDETESPPAVSAAAYEPVRDPAADPLGPLGPVVGALGRSIRSALEPAVARSGADAGDAAGDPQPADGPLDDGLTDI